MVWLVYQSGVCWLGYAGWILQAGIAGYCLLGRVRWVAWLGLVGLGLLSQGL